MAIHTTYPVSGPIKKKLYCLAGKTIKVCIFMFLLCLQFDGHATAWKTSTAGAVTTLGNWTNGVTAPTSFTNPGDTWTVTLAMTMPMPGSWTLGAPSAAPDSLIITTGGTISMGGVSGAALFNIYGDLVMSGGSFILGGSGTTANVNVNDTIYVLSGNISAVGSGSGFHFITDGLNLTGGTITSSGVGTTMLMNINGSTVFTGGTFSSAGTGSPATLNTHGNFHMTGGTFASGGTGGAILNNISGNGSFRGTAAMTCNPGCTSAVHFCLPASSGMMLIDNTSTGTWSGTNVYVDTGCTAVLDNDFGTTTGGAANGLTVNGTLSCPAAFFVNGTGIFTLNGIATLKVAIATGINGAITTSGTKKFNTSANYVFNGVVPQVTGTMLPAALVSPDTISISNSAGVTLSQTTATTGTLLFTAGVLSTTGAYTITVPGAATAVAGAGATSYVNGTLVKTLATLSAITYEVGDADYVPMLLNFSSPGTAGSIGLKSTNGPHPSLGTAGISTVNIVNHYWTITNTGAAGPATVYPRAIYNASDILGGTNASFVTQEYASSAWLGSPAATLNTSAPYTSEPTSGIGLATVAGDYIFGNVFCGTLPITGTSTVCAGSTITLHDATPTGTWVSSIAAAATVSSSGVVTGVAAGTSIISYTVGTCTVTTVVTVNPLPNAGTITGADTTVCAGKTIALSDAATGGTWSSGNTTLATVNSSGLVTGIAAGGDIITYMVTNSCGTANATYDIKVLSVAACDHVGVNGPEGATDQLIIYPNPSEGAFTIRVESETLKEVQVVVTNIIGTQVQSFTTISNKAVPVKLSAAAGIYLLSASTPNGRYMAKIIVR